jgi:hypothetical protein
MSHDDFTPQHRTIGRAAAWAVFFLAVVYLVPLVLGLRSLASPQDPIGDPYFSMMELLIVLMAPAMVVSMVAVHAYARPEVKVYSFTALAFMLLLAGITSSVHFVILTVSHQIEAAVFPGLPLLLSFTWPSVAYTLDILAWDVFFALAMLFAAPVFKGGRLETTVRILLIVSGDLCLAGLIGVPLANMHVWFWYDVRNIGVLGYAVVAPVAFLLIGMLFGRTEQVPGATKHSLGSQSPA